MKAFPIQFGEWLPDQADKDNPGVVEARNVYPSSGGYTKFETPLGSGDVTTETVMGAAMFVQTNNSPLTVGGSSTKLFTRSPGVVTETSGYTALSTDHVWRFERYNNQIITVTPNNVPQILTDLDTDTSWSALGGSPPKASVIGRVLDFLVMGDLTDIDATTQPYRLRWSAINNPGGAWVTDRGEMSDFRDLDPKYGRITGIIGGRFGIVFQERAIWRMNFVGAPLVFNLDQVSVDRGCTAPDSVVTIGFNTYFLSQDGFYVTDGSSVKGVSSRRASEWFIGEADQSKFKRTQGALHWPKQSIVWSFISTTGASFDRQIIYSFTEDKWSNADESLDFIVRSKTDATTIGALATLFPGGIGGVGVIGNPEWLSKDFSMSAFIASGNGSEYAEMIGPAREATITTADLQPVPGKHSHVTGILPLVENVTGNTRTQVLSRAKQGAAQAASNSTSEGVDGFCPHKVNARFIAARMTVPAAADWDNASGVQIKARVSGAR